MGYPVWGGGRDMAISFILRRRGGKRSESLITFPGPEKTCKSLSLAIHTKVPGLISVSLRAHGQWPQMGFMDQKAAHGGM